jgi:serine/threonine-protein kinase RsbW
MDHEVEIALAADPSLLSVVRVAVAAVGARLELDVDRLDDLQLAVEELCVALVERARAEDRLRVTVGWDDAEVRARCELTRRAGAMAAAPDAARAALSRQILDALVDEHGEADDGQVSSRWLRTSRADDARQ